MNYEVNWRDDAEAALADLWLNATDRDAVAHASNEIDRQLSRTPWLAGESRDGVTRILIVEPLAVYFDVIQDDKRVLVFDVWATSN